MISLGDPRLVGKYFDAEKHRLTCEPVPFTLDEFLVSSKSDPSRRHFVKFTEQARGPVVGACSCQHDGYGEPRPCAHLALAAADYSEAFRLLLADERDRARLDELIAYRDGTLNRRSLSARIRALEERLSKVSDEPIPPRLDLQDIPL